MANTRGAASSLEKYLEVINDALPLFTRERFLSGTRVSLYSRDLILTLVVITAKLIGFTFTSEGFDIDAHIDLMLSSGSLEEDMFGNTPSIDRYRKACLLAFYEFHQFPGHQAWMRIGKLTRMALWIGLDRLESSRTFHPDFGGMDLIDREDWRMIWWSIYHLDSYSNLSAGTPYVIDEGFVGTGLMRDQPYEHALQSHNVHPPQDLYLPLKPDRIWELVSVVASDSPSTSLSNLHIIAETAMRQVGRTLRASVMRPKRESLADLERNLSALRLALPPNYQNPRRNALLNESKLDHHARLVTINLLLMAQLLASLFSCAMKEEEGEEWLLSWQRVLETCQDIAAIAEQWNSSFSLSVDPAMSFIIFTALIFLDLHKKSAAATAPELRSNLEHCETVLLLQLEQFSKTWTLPKLLICE